MHICRGECTVSEDHEAAAPLTQLSQYKVYSVHVSSSLVAFSLSPCGRNMSERSLSHVTEGNLSIPQACRWKRIGKIHEPTRGAFLPWKVWNAATGVRNSVIVRCDSLSACACVVEPTSETEQSKAHQKITPKQEKVLWWWPLSMGVYNVLFFFMTGIAVIESELSGAYQILFELTDVHSHRNTCTFDGIDQVSQLSKF